MLIVNDSFFADSYSLNFVMLNVVKHPAEFGGILLPQGSIRMRESIVHFVTLSGKNTPYIYLKMNFKELNYSKFTIICLHIVWKTLDIRPK